MELSNEEIIILAKSYVHQRIEDELNETYRWSPKELLELLIEFEMSGNRPYEFLQSLNYSVNEEMEEEIREDFKKRGM